MLDAFLSMSNEQLEFFLGSASILLVFIFAAGIYMYRFLKNLK